jgi:hypothetical protein
MPDALDTTNPLAVANPSDTPAVTTPVVAPEPRFSKEDYLAINSVDDAKSFRDKLTEDEKSKWDKGELDAIFGEKKAPEPTDDTKDKKEDKPDEKKEPDAAPEILDPILSEEEYASADARTRAMQDQLLEAFEKLEALENKGEDPETKEIRELIKTDPILKNRIELRMKGETALPSVDIAPEIFLTDEAMAILDKAFITDDNLASAKAAMKDFVKKIYAEAAFRVKTNVEGEYIERAEIAERKNFYQTNIMEFVRSNKDYSSDSPVFIETKEGTKVNPEHKVRPFIEWLTKEINEGRITHEAVKAHGLSAYDQLYRIKTSGSVESFRSQQAGRTRQEMMAQIKAAQQKAKTAGAAPTIRPNTGSGNPASSWNGYDMNRIKIDRGYADQVIRELRSKGEFSKVNDLVKMAQSW